MHLNEDELFLTEDPCFDFSLIELKFGCAEFLRHNNTCIFHKRQIMESSSEYDSGDIFCAEYTIHIL